MTRMSRRQCLGRLETHGAKALLLRVTRTFYRFGVSESLDIRELLKSLFSAASEQITGREIVGEELSAFRCRTTSNTRYVHHVEKRDRR